MQLPCRLRAQTSPSEVRLQERCGTPLDTFQRRDGNVDPDLIRLRLPSAVPSHHIRKKPGEEQSGCFDAEKTSAVGEANRAL